MDQGSIAPQVVRLSLRAQVLVPIRAGLSALGLVAALLVGGSAETTLLAWIFGAFVVSIILASDPRGRRDTTPEPLPADSVEESAAQIARTDVFPSTVGVSVLLIVALFFDPVLAGVLAGILGGMAVMTLVSWIQVALAERKLGGVLYARRRDKRLLIHTPRQ